jgi:hypothetical protein
MTNPMSPAALPVLRSTKTCAKCGLGTELARTSWCSPTRPRDDLDVDGLVCRRGDEHMHRSCPECDFTWLEAVL